MGILDVRPNTAPHATRGSFLTRTVALLATLALAISACGGDGGSSPEPTTAPPATTPSTPGPSPTQTSEEPDDEVLDYYAGEVITIIIPTAPGGSTDVTGRFLAEWLPRYMVGNPSFIIENMPGGGQIVAGNHYANLEPDGLTAIVHSTPAHMAWSFGFSTVDFDFAEYEALFSAGGGHIWLARTDAGFDSLDDLINGTHEPLVTGGTAIGSGEVLQVFALLALGLDVDVTWGYESRAPILLGFEQGEMNIAIVPKTNYPGLQPLIDSGEFLELFTMGELQPDGTIARDPYWPDVPHIGEVHEMMHGVPPSGELWEGTVLGGVLSRSLGRVLLIHNEAPPEALAALRAAIADALEDPEFLDAAFEELGELPIGAETQELMEYYLLGIEQETIDFIVDYVVENYDYNLREG